MVAWGLSIEITPAARGRPAPPRAKKEAGVVEPSGVFDHAGVLVDEPPGPAGVPFI
jgi:hypothetical protein